MTIRDIRTMNMTEGQKIESDNVMKRIGDLAYRNLGTLSKASMFDQGKALIVGDGFRVEPSSGMTVNIPSGSIFQRFIDVIPCLQIAPQTVTLDAATGVARTDIIEAQIKLVTDKNDTSQVATVASGSAIAITNETIKRDIKYYLSARKQTGTTTPTAATAGILTGTVAIAGTIDLSEKYLLNLADGEDGSFQEIDCRGATPEATTRVEIINAINAATGRTIASTGVGDVVVLTGNGTGQSSYFSIQPTFSDADKDCLEIVFGLSIGGIYRYNYEGTNEWFKLAEIDVGTVTTVITTGLIRNVNEKNTWTGGSDEILLDDSLFPGYSFVEQDITAAIDLFDYFNDTILYCNPSADITLTVTNNLPQGKKLVIINTSLDSVITLSINSTTYGINPTHQKTCISSGSSMYIIRESELSPKYIVGLELSAGTTPDENINIAVGRCKDSTDVYDMILTSAITNIDITTTGANALDAGTVAANTWYYIYLIYNPTTKTYAGLLSTNATTPTLPAGYTIFRRVRGARLTDATSDIIDMTQVNDRFEFNSIILDIGSPGIIVPATKTDLTMSTPDSLTVIGIFSFAVNDVGSGFCNIFGSNEVDRVPAIADCDITVTASNPSSIYLERIITDATISWRWDQSQAINDLSFHTRGFIDPAQE